MFPLWAFNFNLCKRFPYNLSLVHTRATTETCGGIFDIYRVISKEIYLVLLSYYNLSEVRGHCETYLAAARKYFRIVLE